MPIPCYPIAQAALCAVARPLRHLARHWANHGVGHGAHHASLHHAVLPHIAAPHAAGPAIMCTRMPGSLLAGPLPGVAAGPAGPGALAGPGSGLAGFTHAGGAGAAAGASSSGTSAVAAGGAGSVFGSNGLAVAASLVAAALIAASVATSTVAQLSKSSLPEQPVSQPVVMASMAPRAMLSPASTAFSPDIPSLGTSVMLAPSPQLSVAIPDLPEQVPKMLAPSTGVSAASMAVSEPASFDLLGLCVLGIVGVREWCGVSQRWFARAKSGAGNT